MSSSPSSNDITIAVEGVGKCYELYPRPIDRLKQTLYRGRRQFYREFWALRDVNLTVRGGEAVGIIGRNGSGKSTLLQVVAGTLRPTCGQVRVAGRVHALLELGSGFNPEFTGRENVFLNGAILGLSRREIQERFDDIARFADIGDFLDQPVKTYSTGMVVRLAFAVQASLDADILVVDEALAVGDEKFQRKCFARLEELRARGASILLVTHSTQVVEQYCQRAVLLERGQVHGIGVSKQIVDQYHALLYADEQAYLRLLNERAAAAAARRGPAPPAPAETPAGSAVPAPLAGVGGGEKLTTTRAQIEEVWVHDGTGTPRDLFDTGEVLEIGFRLRILEAIATIQAGIRIRTVEGVEAYGTSTGYLGKSLSAVAPGSRCAARFRFPARLCAGTYFISVAAAEAVSSSEMRYLDRRTDILMIRIREHPLTGTGIAQLRAEVSFAVVD